MKIRSFRQVTENLRNPTAKKGHLFCLQHCHYVVNNTLHKKKRNRERKRRKEKGKKEETRLFYFPKLYNSEEKQRNSNIWGTLILDHFKKWKKSEIGKREMQTSKTFIGEIKRNKRKNSKGKWKTHHIFPLTTSGSLYD
jgi:hypothetical protein